MSCTLQEVLDALELKLRVAEDNIKSIQEIVDDCKKDATEIRNTIKEIVNIL